MLLLSATACGGTLQSDDELAASGLAGQAAAQCKQPRGTGDVPATKDELRARIPGKWFYCSGAPGFTETDGIEIGADGRFWELVRSGTTLTRKPGVEFSGTWDQDWSDETQPSLVYFRYANKSFTFQTLIFEKSPQRMIGSGMQGQWNAVPLAE